MRWVGRESDGGEQVINSRLGRAGEPEGAGRQRGWGAKRGCGQRHS